VRECSLVSSTNRGEARRSDYIIQRSTIVTPVNQEANATREGRVLHANGSMSAGLQGQRQTKSGEAEDPDSKARQTVRGEIRIRIQLANSRCRHAALACLNNICDKRKKKVAGRIPYRSLYAHNAQHMDLLHAELVHRGLGDDQVASLGYQKRIANQFYSCSSHKLPISPPNLLHYESGVVPSSPPPGCCGAIHYPPSIGPTARARCRPALPRSSPPRSSRPSTAPPLLATRPGSASTALS